MRLIPTLSHGAAPEDLARWRAVTGALLLIHWLQLLPWAGELFSSAGVLAEPELSPLFGLIPSPLQLSDSPWMAMALVASAALAALAMALGRGDRLGAALQVLIGAWLLGRNPLILNPAMPFVGWSLLAYAARPRGEALSPELTAAAWIILTLAYAYSGVTKLASPSWVRGEALGQVLSGLLAYDGPVRWLAEVAPPIALKLATWGTLALELGAPVLALSRRARPWLWLGLTALQLGILASVDFADLTVGMLIAQALIFDPAWLRRAGEAEQDPCAP